MIDPNSNIDNSYSRGAAYSSFRMKESTFQGMNRRGN